MLASFATVMLLVFILLQFFSPMWETNDDVGMSMIAHGYGMAASGSPPNLLFSNVIWGYLVRAIPTIHGVLGYTIASYSVLILSASVILYGLFALGAGYLTSLSVLVLMFTRAILFPQFTLNAGFLVVAAVICWTLYARRNNWRVLAFSSVLAWLGFLVRNHESILVFVMALPLLPWRELFRTRSSKIVFSILFSMTLLSAVIDHQAYQGPEWKAFNDLNPVRVHFTDYRAEEVLEKRPELRNKFGYSANDIALLRDFFFVDPHLADPNRLRTMLHELGPVPMRGNAASNVWIGLRALWHPLILISMAAALLLFLLSPSWQLALSWGLCLSIIIAMGLFGRPGILRVYFPLISLLTVAPFLVTNFSQKRKWMIVGVLMLAALVNAIPLMTKSRYLKSISGDFNKVWADFPAEPVVVWGSAFPYEAIYPVMSLPPTTVQPQLYALGVFTLAPFSLASAEEHQGRGMIDRLLSKTGVPIAASGSSFHFLETYCKEHDHGPLQYIAVKHYGAVAVNWVRCDHDVSK